MILLLLLLLLHDLVQPGSPRHLLQSPVPGPGGARSYCHTGFPGQHLLGLVSFPFLKTPFPPPSSPSTSTLSSVFFILFLFVVALHQCCSASATSFPASFPPDLCLRASLPLAPCLLTPCLLAPCLLTPCLPCPLPHCPQPTCTLPLCPSPIIPCHLASLPTASLPPTPFLHSPENVQGCIKREHTWRHDMDTKEIAACMGELLGWSSIISESLARR